MEVVLQQIHFLHNKQTCPWKLKGQERSLSPGILLAVISLCRNEVEKELLYTYQVRFSYLDGTAL